MASLAKEFSMELLLSFVEIVQYKAELEKIMKIINAEIELKSVNNKILSDEIISKLSDGKIVVKSVMIQNGFYSENQEYKESDDECEFIKLCKKVCLAIFNKYISDQSELEVNISADNRAELEHLMKRDDYFINSVNMNVNDLYQIFDKVAIEMFRLLSFAYTRFVKTKEFQSARTSLTKIKSTSQTSITLSE